MHPTPAQIQAMARRDPALAEALKKVPPFPVLPTPEHRRMSHFHYLSRAIIYQQLATAAARTIYGRVKALTPGRGFPKPAEILELPDEELRGAGLSGSKMKAIRDLAERVEDGRLKLRGLGKLDEDEVVERLTSVWGIGEWTAQMHLIFKLGRLDVMPATDLGVQEGLRILDGLDERPTPAELLERAELWRPYRSVASWILWRLTDGGEP